MAAAYRSHSATTYASRTDTLIAAPAGIQDGDQLRLIFVRAQSGSTPATPTWPAGFSPVSMTSGNNPGTVSDGGLYLSVWVLEKTASGESGDYTVIHGAGSSQGLMICVSGATTGGQVTQNQYNGVNDGATATANGVTTGANDSLLIYLAQNWQLWGSGTAPAGSTPTFNERLDAASSILYYADGVLATAGATGNKTQAAGGNGASDPWQAWLIEVQAAASVTRDQEGFRWGLDDASESSHTWAQAQDTNDTVALDTARLLRVLVDATGDPASTAYTLRYQKNGAGGYLPVPVGPTATYDIPTWQSSATPASGTGAVTWPLPASFAERDLLVWVAESANQAVPTAPTGATQVGSSPQGTGTAAATTATRLTVFAKIATGSETTNSAGDAGDHTLVSCFAIRGAHQTLSDALHVVAGDVAASASTSVTCPGGTTTVPNCLILNIVSNATDSATAQGSAWANANLGSVTERLDFGTTSGNGGGITVISGTLATAGSIGGTTGTLATSSVQGRITLAIRPPADVTNEVYVAASSNIASGGEATTARLSAPSGKSTSDFVVGRRWDDKNGTDTIDITADDYTEVEWCLKVQAPAANADYFDFRVYAGAVALDSYGVTPRLTATVSGGSFKAAWARGSNALVSAVGCS